ncbi:MAG: hypothetical protein WDA00_03785 [Eubacteriales bacterium]
MTNTPHKLSQKISAFWHRTGSHRLLAGLVLLTLLCGICGCFSPYTPIIGDEALDDSPRFVMNGKTFVEGDEHWFPMRHTTGDVGDFVAAIGQEIDIYSDELHGLEIYRLSLGTVDTLYLLGNGQDYRLFRWDYERDLSPLSDMAHLLSGVGATDSAAVQAVSVMQVNYLSGEDIDALYRLLSELPVSTPAEYNRHLVAVYREAYGTSRLHAHEDGERLHYLSRAARRRAERLWYDQALPFELMLANQMVLNLRYYPNTHYLQCGSYYFPLSEAQCEEFCALVGMEE